MNSLKTLGLNKHIHYETIITTKYKNKPNAAPIGVICTGDDTIMCRIFKNSTTLKNICKTNEFTVNILNNPLAFTYATLFTVPQNYLALDNSIKCANSYFKCKVQDIKEVIKTNDPINKSQKYIIKAKVEHIKINNDGNPHNRAMDLIIESIYNFKNFDENPDYYIKRLKEAKRIITKVGSKQDKKAINILIEAIKNRGFSL